MTGLLLQSDASLKALNTFGVDARAAWLATVATVDGLREALDHPGARSGTWVLGDGSNVLITGPVERLVIRPAFGGIEVVGEDERGVRVRVGAGENWHRTVSDLVLRGLAGLENLALIPGRVGAAPIQNIGAYGLELAERLHSVEYFDLVDATCRTLSLGECRFGYRDSVFRRELAGRAIVTALTLELPRPWRAVVGYADLAVELASQGVSEPGPVDVMRAVVAIRRRKLPDPAVLGNAGSFFRNPVVDGATHLELIDRHPSLVSYPIGGGRFKLAAGWLIEACGLKGATRGRAGVYERQALVLVNRGGATGAEILALAREVQQKVEARFGIRLEPEPQIL